MSDRDGPLFLVVTIKPRLDRLEEAETQLQSMRRKGLEEPGCVFMHMVQPHDDPDTWVMLEMFRSRAAWDEHMLQPYNTEATRSSRTCFASRQICGCSTKNRVRGGTPGYIRRAGCGVVRI